MVNNQHDDKTRKILEAAQKRFAHFGLDKTSMLEIANDLGISKASLYYYFTDKESLFIQVIQEETNGFISNIENHFKKDISTEKMLVIYIKKRLSYFQNFVNISKLSAESLKSVKPLFTDLSEKFKKEEIRLVKKIFQKGIERGELTKISISEHADLFVSLMQGLRSHYILRKGLANVTESDYSQLEKQFIQLAKIFFKSLIITNGK